MENTIIPLASDGTNFVPFTFNPGILALNVSPLFLDINNVNSRLTALAANVNTDAVDLITVQAVELLTAAVTYGFNGATFDRIRTLADNGDAQAALTLGLLATMARLEGFNGATFDRLRTLVDNADGQATGILGLLGIENRAQLFNGATFDRQRGNTEFTILASAVRSASNNSADFTNYNSTRLFAFLNITAVPGADTITVAIQSKDPVSGNYATTLSGTAQGAVGLSVIPTTAIGVIVPRTFRVLVSHSGAGNFTYSIGGCST
jgi:hypothetical protein